MKRITCFLFAALATLSLSFATTPMTDDDDQEEKIDIIYNGPGEGGGDNNMRGGIYVPISATYSSFHSLITVVFSENLGDIDIKVTNLITGAVSIVPVDSSAGSVYVPVTLGNGFYLLEFVSGGATLYYGYFSAI